MIVSYAWRLCNSSLFFSRMKIFATLVVSIPSEDNEFKDNLFNGISTPNVLFNAEIWLISKFLIMVDTYHSQNPWIKKD